MRLFHRASVIVAGGLAVTFLSPWLSAHAAAPSAALAVQISPSSTSIAEANPTSFTISVTNRGPNTAPAANLAFYFESDPRTFQLNLSTVVKPESGNPNHAYWALGNLAVGRTVSTQVALIGQQVTGSNPNAVTGALILTATSQVPNPLLIHDRAGDTYSVSRVLSTTAPLSHNPLGHLDSVMASGNTVRVRGWAADPDNLFASLPIALSNNGVRSGGFKHPTARPDVVHARGTGLNVGFDIPVTLQPGRHQICAIATNIGAGTPTTIGCTTLTIR